MTAGEIVIYLDDPLLFGELLVVDVTPDDRLLCEAVNWHDEGHEDDAPPRAILTPDQVELADVWARVE